VPAEFVEWVEERLARGDEVALHGYTHRDEGYPPSRLHDRLRRAVYTAGEGEFAALTRDEAVERIERGRAWFAQRGWPLSGFVAPAWLVSDGTWEALQRFRFAYTTTLTQFHALEQRIVVRTPSLVYSTRSAWRRGASLGWNSALAAAGRHARCVRVGLHPADAQHGTVMRHALARIAQLARDRQTLTKAAFARALR
jgi:predicted deacetylase